MVGYIGKFRMRSVRCACAELCYFAEMMTGLIEGLLVSTIGGKPKDING